ncbi:hypothetical protein ACH47X_11700 [Promicromonospora kroppenstedtii]|uniref:Uncharacterized protein n=1 Tax=Promicromonospora kroppenstedtii TaxID=440482 RepID=A0ABW7XJ76_9MICO
MAIQPADARWTADCETQRAAQDRPVRVPDRSGKAPLISELVSEMYAWRPTI